MMSLADILQLVVLCALLFFPLGYLTRHYQRRIRTTLRLWFFHPGSLTRAGVFRGGPRVKPANPNNSPIKTRPRHRFRSGSTGAALAAGTSTFWSSLPCCGPGISISIRC